ncbi:MAG: hypothetical protein HZA24_00475 [Nitrospirae bacterium]|nr:hypothetical protein [Nitrospirota bacterium]
MPYRHLPYETISNPEFRKVFHHADMLFHDVYGMFKRPEVDGGGGGCNFSIALVLLCVIDGFGSEVYPTRVDSHGKPIKPGDRFKGFVRDKLLPQATWRDTDPNKAAEDLYKQFRNPLVHALAGDEPDAKKERGNLAEAEPVIGKWGLIHEDNWDIDLFDTVDEWSARWPLLFRHESEDGSCMKLCCAALYCALKRTAMDLIKECRES